MPGGKDPKEHVLNTLQSRHLSAAGFGFPCSSPYLSCSGEGGSRHEDTAHAGDKGGAKGGAEGKDKENPAQPAAEAPAMVSVIKPVPGRSRFNTAMEANPLAAVNLRCCAVPPSVKLVEHTLPLLFVHWCSIVWRWRPPASWVYDRI